MKSLKAMTGAAAAAVARGEVATPPSAPLRSVDDQTGEVVEKIFRQLQAIFPAWRQAWPNEKTLATARRSWTKGFMDAGISSIEQVEFGIKKCRRSGSPFAPSIGQFIEWCTLGPEELGLPVAEDAWMEALLCTYSHEAVRLAATATGLFDLRAAKQDDKGLRQRFDRNYEVILRRAQAGQPLDGKILTGIGHDSQKTELELADELAEQEHKNRIAKQGIPADGKSARALLMAKFGKRTAQ
jgi:hypothetical protein